VLLTRNSQSEEMGRGRRTGRLAWVHSYHGDGGEALPSSAQNELGDYPPQYACSRYGKRLPRLEPNTHPQAIPLLFHLVFTHAHPSALRPSSASPPNPTTTPCLSIRPSIHPAPLLRLLARPLSLPKPSFLPSVVLASALPPKCPHHEA
jgi:hypothetical protein